MAEQVGAGVLVRAAGTGDARLLRDVERAANLVALAHVFPPEQHAFPDAAVEQRWAALLADPSVAVWLARDQSGAGGRVGDGEPVGLVAHDDLRVRHLAVVPAWWGRGLGGALLARAVAGVRERGGTPRLWCLELNTRARGLYERRGWRATGVSRAGEFPPYPTELELVLADPARGTADLAGSRP